MSAVTPLDFMDTKIAFASRSNLELRQAKILFQSFNFPLLVAAGPKLAGLALRLHLPVEMVIRRTFFNHFCGGVTIADCRKTVAELGRFAVCSILDYSVEGLGREADFDRTFEETLRTITEAGQSPLTPFAVFKVTGLGRLELLAKSSAGLPLSTAEQAELTRVEQRVARLCRAAKDAGRKILIDAEESWIQPAIDNMAEMAMRTLNQSTAVVYNTLQMYRKDRLEQLKTAHQKALTGGYKLAVKLVRGAYMEKERARAAALGLPSPIHENKAACDQAFNAALAYSVEHLADIALFAGSHNEDSNLLLTQLMERHNVARNDERVEFSQLLGMSDNLTYNLAHSGYRVAKYVPYGPVRAVLPYLVRRAEENSSIKGQAGRELQLLERELRRRLNNPR